MTGASIDEKDNLLAILDELGQGSKFLWTIFVLTLSPTIFNGMQSMSYVFTTEIPEYWCDVPELSAANWTQQQIRAISSESSCTIYDHNYTHFAQVGYDRALEYISALPSTPDFSSCARFSYEDIGRSTVVEEWNLVCDRAADRANTYMALSLGKLVGAGFGGVCADRYGRKVIYLIGIFVLMIAGPLTAFTPWFWSYLLLRWFTGVSLSFIGYSSMTILNEASGNRHRQWMGIAFNAGYPLGTALLSGVAYLAPDWRHLQLTVSAPALLLIFHACIMPESPRWLLSQGRFRKARCIIEKNYDPKGRSPKKTATPSSWELHEKPAAESKDTSIPETEGFISSNLRGLKLLFSHGDLRKRAFIMYFSWMTSSLCYYVIALNVDNFSADHYLYVLIMGLTEIPAYLMPSGVLMLMGRRQAGALLYTIGGVCLLCILGIPQGCTPAIMAVALTGRFALSSVYGIIILYTSELFPTVVRNSAVGTCSVMAHVGTIAAPYVADLFGQVTWWAPSTLCGILALIAGLSCLVLPETRKRPLADTVEQETTEARGKVSLTKCFKQR